MYGWEFKKLVWRMKRELRTNRKPILLFYGNGYESQILALALHKMHKSFTFVHVASPHVDTQKVKRVMKKLGNNIPIILHIPIKSQQFKSFEIYGPLLIPEESFAGFSLKDYCIVTGFKLDEPSIVKCFMSGGFERMYSPLMRCPDEYVEDVYEEIENSGKLGKFMSKNLTSDSK